MIHRNANLEYALVGSASHYGLVGSEIGNDLGIVADVDVIKMI